MGRIESELEKLREEIEALASGRAVGYVLSAEDELAFDELAERLTEGEEIPEELLDRSGLGGFVPVLSEMIAEGYFGPHDAVESR